MDEIRINLNEGYVTQIPINGAIYDAKIVWTLSDLKYVSKEDDDFTEEDCQTFVKELIAKSIHLENGSEIAYNASESDLHFFIDEFLKYKPSFAEFFDSSSDISYCQNFVLACKKGTTKSMSESIKAISPALERLRESIGQITSSMFEGLNPLIEASRKLGEIISKSEPAWNEQFKRLAEAFKSITIPQINEKRKNELVESYRTWGTYGWTYIPSIDDTLFDEKIPNKHDADRLAMKLISADTITYLFDELGNLKRIKKSDLQELKSSYEHGLYKATCMIAFAMIDSKLIRLQPIDHSEKPKRRDPGNKNSIDKFLKRITDKIEIDKLIFALLDTENLISCLITFFAQANDFRTQPAIVNRNFLDHGMLHRKVTRKDAIQLILLTYNFYRIMDDIIY